MTTAATRDLGWRTMPASVVVPARPRARHQDRPWMGKPLSAWPDDELRGILFALELTAYGRITPSEGMDRDELVRACGEVDSELGKRRGKGRVHA